MDKKEQRRDVAVFSNMLKDIMNEKLDSNLATLDRDLQHFIYGRVALLVKHNQGQPVGTVADLSAVVGAAFSAVLSELIRDNVKDSEALQKIVLTARENLVDGFQSRVLNLNDIQPESQPVEETQ